MVFTRRIIRMDFDAEFYRKLNQSPFIRNSNFTPRGMEKQQGKIQVYLLIYFPDLQSVSYYLFFRTHAYSANPSRSQNTFPAKYPFLR